MKKAMLLVLKVILLTIVGIISLIISSAIIPQPGIISESQAVMDSQEALKMLFLLQFIFSLVFVFILSKSKISGIKLFYYLLWISFGVGSFVMQLETIIFIKVFPAISYADVGLIMLSSLTNFIIFIPLAMLIAGKWKKQDVKPLNKLIQDNFIYKIPVLAICFILLYFFFGYFIAFQFTAVRDFYQNSTIQNNLVILTGIQFFRGILWVLAGLPLLLLFDKKSDLIVSSILVYGVFSSAALILPNPLMPGPVRFGHFIEIFVSMSLFGLIIPLILTYKRPVKLPEDKKAGV